MKKLFVVLLLTVSPLFYGNSFSTTYAEKFNEEKFYNDIDTISRSVDSAKYYGKEIVSVLSQEVKTYGLKKTIQANGSIFAPAFIFFVLFLLYLKGRTK